MEETRVHIYGLNFQGCSGNKFKMNNLLINMSTFSHNYGAALEVNRTKNASIQNVSFVSNSALDCKDSDPQCYLVGGALRIIISNISIYSSVFIDLTQHYLVGPFLDMGGVVSP